MHEIQNKLQDIIDKLSQEDFIFDFLLSYDQPKSTIAKSAQHHLPHPKERITTMMSSTTPHVASAMMMRLITLQSRQSCANGTKAER